MQSGRSVAQCSPFRRRLFLDLPPSVPLSITGCVNAISDYSFPSVQEMVMKKGFSKRNYPNC